MRILLVNKYYHLRSGAERYMLGLQGLLESQGHTVAVFSMQHPRNLPSPYDSHFVPQVDYPALGWAGQIRAGMRAIWYPGAARRIAHVLDVFQPDLVQIHNIYHQISPSILPPIRRRGIPVVQRLHDYKLICPNYLLYTRGAPCTRCRTGNYFHAVRHHCVHGSLAWSLLAAVEMSVHKALRVYEGNVDVFTTPSAFVKEMAESFGVPEQQLVHIPGMVDLDRFVPADGDAGYFAYVGRLSHEKGLLTLMRAMQDAPEAQLLVVGDGPVRAQMEEMSTDLRLTNVRFAGHLSGAALYGALAGARFTVLPSEWYEVLGLSILESFAVTKPVIASRIGGMPELVEHGRDGLLFEPGNASELAACIRNLWNDQERVHWMGVNGRRKVPEQYVPSEHYRRLFSAYNRLVSG